MSFHVPSTMTELDGVDREHSAILPHALFVKVPTARRLGPACFVSALFFFFFFFFFAEAIVALDVIAPRRHPTTRQQAKLSLISFHDHAITTVAGCSRSSSDGER